MSFLNSARLRKPESVFRQERLARFDKPGGFLCGSGATPSSEAETDPLTVTRPPHCLSFRNSPWAPFICPRMPVKHDPFTVLSTIRHVEDQKPYDFR